MCYEEKMENDLRPVIAKEFPVMEGGESLSREMMCSMEDEADGRVGLCGDSIQSSARDSRIHLQHLPIHLQLLRYQV